MIIILLYIKLIYFYNINSLINIKWEFIILYIYIYFHNTATDSLVAISLRYIISVFVINTQSLLILTDSINRKY